MPWTRTLELEESVGIDQSNSIAEIAVDSRTRKVTRINFHKNNAGFRCQRCAIFCCKLGPPQLCQKDIARLKLSGQRPDKLFDERRMTLRSREDGSCGLLSLDPRNSKHRCDVYSFRPRLCRLYPFQFQKLNKSNYALRLITCCNGLNTNDGFPINRSFVTRLVKSELLALIDSNLI